MSFKNLFRLRFLCVILGLALMPEFSAKAETVATEPNTLSDAEKKAGWVLLFDGKTFEGWRSYKADKPAKTWSIEHGALHNAPHSGYGGDLVTMKTYSDFELQWEWKIAPGANSGLKYFVNEEREGTSAVGHEYQMIDDEHYKSPLKKAQHTAALYDVLPPKTVHPRPIGEFNQSRVLVHGNHVEQWLNGEKAVEYDLGSEAMKAAIAKSKFKAMENFGNKIKGHILLQNHGDEVWFRNLKLRDLSAK